MLSYYACFADVNECVLGNAECSKDATCKNTFGSYECKCKDGFTGNGFSCKGLQLYCWLIGTHLRVTRETFCGGGCQVDDQCQTVMWQVVAFIVSQFLVSNQSVNQFASFFQVSIALSLDVASCYGYIIVQRQMQAKKVIL